MDALANFRASGIRMIVFEDDSITAFCDGCGRAIPWAEANFAKLTTPFQGTITLCDKCLELSEEKSEQE